MLIFRVVTGTAFQQGMKTIYDKQLRDTDQLRFLRNCPPTPPLTQHIVFEELRCNNEQFI